MISRILQLFAICSALGALVACSGQVNTEAAMTTADAGRQEKSGGISGAAALRWPKAGGGHVISHFDFTNAARQVLTVPSYRQSIGAASGSVTVDVGPGVEAYAYDDGCRCNMPKNRTQGGAPLPITAQTRCIMIVSSDPNQQVTEDWVVGDVTYDVELYGFEYSGTKWLCASGGGGGGGGGGCGGGNFVAVGAVPGNTCIDYPTASSPARVTPPRIEIDRQCNRFNFRLADGQNVPQLESIEECSTPLTRIAFYSGQGCQGTPTAVRDVTSDPHTYSGGCVGSASGCSQGDRTPEAQYGDFGGRISSFRVLRAQDDTSTNSHEYGVTSTLQSNLEVDVSWSSTNPTSPDPFLTWLFFGPGSLHGEL